MVRLKMKVRQREQQVCHECGYTVPLWIEAALALRREKDAERKKDAKRGSKPLPPGKLVSIRTGQVLPQVVTRNCFCCGRPNDRTRGQEPWGPKGPWRKEGPGQPRKVKVEWLEAYARIAQLRAENELWQSWIALLERAHVIAGATTRRQAQALRRLLEEWGSSFEGALSAGGGEFLIPTRNNKAVAERAGIGAIHLAKEILEQAQQQLAEWGDDATVPARASEPDDDVSADVVELFAEESDLRWTGPGSIETGKRNREKLLPSSMRGWRESLEEPEPPRPEGRPSSPGTRDAAEAELLILAAARHYFGHVTVEQLRRWCRKSKATRETYPRVAELVVYRLLDIERSVTVDALAEVLEVKKSKVYAMRKDGAPAPAVAA